MLLHIPALADTGSEAAFSSVITDAGILMVKEQPGNMHKQVPMLNLWRECKMIV